MAVFPAKTFPLPAAARAWMESEAVFSLRSLGSLAKYDRLSSSWKTFQLLIDGAETLSSELWPTSGMTLDGTCFQLQMWARTTGVNDGGFWRTPDTGVGGTSGLLKEGKTHRKSGAAITMRLVNQVNNPRLWPTPRAEHDSGRHRGKPDTLHSAVKAWPTPTACAGQNPGEHGQGGQNLATEVGGQLNPPWVEWLMGYPSEWTALEDWATAWFRPKRGKRSSD